MPTIDELERAIAYWEVFEKEIYEMPSHPVLEEQKEPTRIMLSALRSALDRERNEPLTWNERINQMTVEEKAKWLYDFEVCRIGSISIDECNSYRNCTECMRNMLNSPAEVEK